MTTLLEKAIALAVQAHAGAIGRDGLPYILHPLHLMMQMESEAAMITAVLHDTVEDTPVTMAELAQLGLSEEVLTAVALLTHDKENVPYDTYIAGIKNNPLARQVKLADLLHNMDIRRLAQVKEKDLVRLQKYRRAWFMLTGQ